MEDIHHQLANLTPEQRRLVEVLLSTGEEVSPVFSHAILQQQTASVTPVRQARHDMVAGTVPLTPNQIWFLGRGPANNPVVAVDCRTGSGLTLYLRGDQAYQTTSYIATLSRDGFPIADPSR